MGRAVGRWLVTTPGANAPPLLNQEGSLWSAPGWAPSPPEDAVLAMMYMKTQGLIGNSRNLLEIACH